MTGPVVHQHLTAPLVCADEACGRPRVVAAPSPADTARTRRPVVFARQATGAGSRAEEERSRVLGQATARVEEVGRSLVELRRDTSERDVDLLLALYRRRVHRMRRELDRLDALLADPHLS